jgi:hypothetical protein
VLLCQSMRAIQQLKSDKRHVQEDVDISQAYDFGTNSEIKRSRLVTRALPLEGAGDMISHELTCS